MNRVILIGNLTKDPVSSRTNSGLTYCRFSIAINNFGDKAPDYIPIVAWEKVAENCSKYLKKGSKVAVEGTLHSNSYDSQNGERRFTLDITAQRVEFLSPIGKEENNGTSNKFSPDPAFDSVTPIQEDLDF